MAVSGGHYTAGERALLAIESTNSDNGVVSSIGASMLDYGTTCQALRGSA